MSDISCGVYGAALAAGYVFNDATPRFRSIFYFTWFTPQLDNKDMTFAVYE
jgi:hypothetical protein